MVQHVVALLITVELRKEQEERINSLTRQVQLTYERMRTDSVLQELSKDAASAPPMKVRPVIATTKGFARR